MGSCNRMTYEEWRMAGTLKFAARANKGFVFGSISSKRVPISTFFFIAMCTTAGNGGKREG